MKKNGQEQECSDTIMSVPKEWKWRINLVHPYIYNHRKVCFDVSLLHKTQNRPEKGREFYLVVHPLKVWTPDK